MTIFYTGPLCHRVDLNYSGTWGSILKYPLSIIIMNRSIVIFKGTIPFYMFVQWPQTSWVGKRILTIWVIVILKGEGRKGDLQLNFASTVLKYIETVETGFQNQRKKNSTNLEFSMCDTCLSSTEEDLRWSRSAWNGKSIHNIIGLLLRRMCVKHQQF